ncbi:hypothetical protein [Salinibacter altiplanensis]|uniref:hypothetical protein n=1 Tax=Salinibacter altiplanensis TaxID=1803181 RepID=UPI001E54404F|nr:hypothetical protein [Salinibacter altiplanensis]
MSRVWFGLALMVLASVSVGACSSPTTLQSHSLSQAPAVDGALSEWGGALTRVDGRSVSMSAAPTDSLLYLAVVIPDRALIRSVAENGLIVWVDPAGEERHTYGVRYPLGRRAQQAGADQRGGASGADAPREGALLEDLFPSDLAVIRNDTVRYRMPAGLSSALKAQATLDTGSLIYEMAVPVSASRSATTSDRWEHGLHARPGGTVAVGLQVPDPDDTDLVTPSSQGIPSVTGRGGGRRSPRGRRRGRQRQQRQQPSAPAPERPTLDLWTRIALSGGS